MSGKMAIIGDGDSILVFTSVGIDAFPVKNGIEAGEKIKELAKSYKIIFITDVFAVENDELIKKYLSSSYPIILTIPSNNGSNGYGETALKNAMEKALGIDLFINDNK